MKVFLNEEVKRFSSPIRGCNIYATAQNMTRKAGELIGQVVKVEGSIITFFDGQDHQHVIWKFPRGEVNSWITFGA